MDPLKILIVEDDKIQNDVAFAGSVLSRSLC